MRFDRVRKSANRVGSTAGPIDVVGHFPTKCIPAKGRVFDHLSAMGAASWVCAAITDVDPTRPGVQT
jgi:hypothetical protein